MAAAIAADSLLHRPTYFDSCRRAHARADEEASSTGGPRATSSTRAALLTDPTRMVPRRARERTSSGTPGSPYIAGILRMAGMATVRPVRQLEIASPAGRPATDRRTPPVAGRPSAVVTSTASETPTGLGAASSRSTPRIHAG